MPWNLTESQHRNLASQLVQRARKLRIGDLLRGGLMQEARQHVTAANNLAWQARLGMKEAA